MPGEGSLVALSLIHPKSPRGRALLGIYSMTALFETAEVCNWWKILGVSLPANINFVMYNC
jgi:hypothetical protein